MDTQRLRILLVDDDYLITRDLLSDIEGGEFDLEWVTAIEDDGKGFDVEKLLVSALNEKRMGLRSMEERVSLLEGKMRIQSRPIQGTKT